MTSRKTTVQKLPFTSSLVLAWAATTLLPCGVRAHEDHAPLPAKGVTVAGDTIMLSDKAREAIGVTTAKIDLADLHRTVEVNARVELPWRQQAMITSLVPGKIDKVLVRPGESVAAGQELACLVSSELESLQLALLQASAEVALAGKLVQQQTTLNQQGVIAGKSLLEAQAKLTGKLASLAITRRKLLALGLDVETIAQMEQSNQPPTCFGISSPRDGIITHADVRVGQLVRPTDHLYHVVDPSTVWIVGDVLESDVRHLRKGQSVEASFVAQPGKTFEGQIDHVRLKMDRRTRTQAVVVAVDNGDGALRPGMHGRVRIAVDVAREAIVCPIDALIESRNGTFVLAERSKGKYESRRVKLGLQHHGRAEVLDGVFPGDRVVLVGNYLLASLLGNEHKARSTGEMPVQRDPTLGPSPITVAHATVEVPTDRKAFATSRIEGRISQVLVEPSQHVRAGHVLAEVDSLQLRTVQLDLLQTLVQARLAEQSLRRFDKLKGREVLPKRRLWELQNELETLRLRTQSLKRQLALLGFSEDQVRRLEQTDLAQENSGEELLTALPIRAPLDGWIVDFDVVPGQVVRPQDALFEIHDLSKVWVKGYVFERHAARVMLGQPARVAFAAFTDLEAEGTVVRIAPTMEEKERVLPVWVEVANPDRLLKEGMLARVTVFAPTADGNRDGVAQIRNAE